MVRYLWIGLLVCCCFSCQKPGTSLTMPEEKLVNLLADVHVAEAIMQTVPTVDRDSLGKVYYGIIYRTHQISEAAFEAEMRLLREDPVLLEQVYTKVVEVLATREAALQTGPTDIQALPDSLEN